MRIGTHVIATTVIAVTGCSRPERPPDGPELDPHRVVGVEELVGQHGMSITLFGYNDPDERGWPSRPEHRRFVRYLQDNGVTVAFIADPASGLRFLQVGGRDVPKVADLEQQAAARGIAVPEMVPRQAEPGAAPERSEPNR